MLHIGSVAIVYRLSTSKLFYKGRLHVLLLVISGQVKLIYSYNVVIKFKYSYVVVAINYTLQLGVTPIWWFLSVCQIHDAFVFSNLLKQVFTDSTIQFCIISTFQQPLHGC